MINLESINERINYIEERIAIRTMSLKKKADAP